MIYGLYYDGLYYDGHEVLIDEYEDLPSALRCMAEAIDNTTYGLVVLTRDNETIFQHLIGGHR